MASIRKRHESHNNLISHIFFALKYEGIDLLILKTIFKLIGEKILQKQFGVNRPVNIQDESGFFTNG